MKRPLILALAASATLLCAGAAQAGNVHWSVGINLPPVATLISSGPVYYPAPAQVYYPAPVAYAPYAPPVVYEQPEVVYAEPQVVYRAPRVIGYAPRLWERTGYYAPRHEGRWVPPVRDSRWIAPREGRRYPHNERSEYRY
ncbi:MAG: hypothetical protein ABI809_11680 [Caldimonas sp.]